MIGLTQSQIELRDFLAAEQAAGRKPTYAAMAAALGMKRPSQALYVHRGIKQRQAVPEFDGFPCGPNGERLRFIPVSALPDITTKEN